MLRNKKNITLLEILHYYKNITNIQQVLPLFQILHDTVKDLGGYSKHLNTYLTLWM